MRKSVLAAAVSLGLGAALCLAPGAVAVAVTPHIVFPTSTGAWTQLSDGVGGGANEAGIVRTPDGVLHLAWMKRNADATWSIGYTDYSAAGRLVGTGTIISGWDQLQSTPRLLPWGTGVRLVFNGSQNTDNNNPYTDNARYTATSPDGITWTLVAGSLSSFTAFNQSLTATTEVDGTPVTSEGTNNALFWHVGVDTAVPSTTPDASTSGQAGSSTENATLVRDSTGAVWLSWYQAFESHQGYYVQQILPTVGAAAEVAGSGNPAWGDNSPHQSVAAVARVGGGVYLAYCLETKGLNCAQVELWKVGSAKPTLIPGSSDGTTAKVAIAASPGGRLVIAWLDTAKGVIDLVRTNDKVSRFSAVTAVSSPPKTEGLVALALESSLGPVDLVANIQRDAPAFPIAFWHRQVLPKPRLAVSATSFSHSAAVALTFHATDVGDPLAGARVTFDGKSATTNAKGVAVLRLAKGVGKGARAAVVHVSGYASVSVAVTTT